MLLFCKKNNVEVSAYSVLTPTFIIEPKKRAARLSFCVGKLGAVNIGSNKYVIICIV